MARIEKLTCVLESNTQVHQKKDTMCIRDEKPGVSDIKEATRKSYSAVIKSGVEHRKLTNKNCNSNSDNRNRNSNNENKASVDVSSESTSKGKVAAQRVNNDGTTSKNMNRKHSCLLVFDSFTKDFNDDKFTGRFEVLKHEIKNLTSESEQCTVFEKELQKYNLKKFDIIYLHVGYNDVLQGRDPRRVLDAINKLVIYLTGVTPAKICISTPIRINHDKQLDRKLKTLDDGIFHMVYEGQLKKFKYRITISNLYGLKHYTVKVHNESKAYKLNNRGELKLYLKIKDGMLTSQRQKSYRRKSENKG